MSDDTLAIVLGFVGVIALILSIFAVSNIFSGSYSDLTGVPSTFPYGNLTGVPSIYDLNNGSVLYLPLNEGSGTVAYDYSGNINTATLNATVQWNSGKYGSALSFNGIDSCALVNDSASFSTITTGITIGIWLNPIAVSASAEPLRKGIGYSLFISGGSISLYLTIGGVTTASNSKSITTGSWQYFTWTYSTLTNQIIAYKNGASASIKATSGGVITTSGVMSLGYRNTYTDRYYNGFIDEVRIYNRALSSVEVSLLYNNTLSVVVP